MNASDYQKVATTLGLDSPQTALIFQNNRDVAGRDRQVIDDELKKIEKSQISIGVEISKLQEKGREIEDEIESLKQRKSQIPSHDIRIRDRLLTALNQYGMDATEETLPFVGELLKVRDDYEAWEPAIQRLLGGFGRQLLVPEDYYFTVSEFVEQEDLKGKLVYHRVRDSKRAVSEDHLPANALYHRLQIKTGTIFREWLRERLIDAFSYICCDDLNEFRRTKRAITINGQIKHGGERHEKDDRYKLGDRRRYVLGWENAEKIQDLEAELKQLGDEFARMANDDKQLNKKKTDLGKRQNAYNNLLFYQSFDALDVSPLSQQLTERQDELDRLKVQVEQSQLAQLRDDVRAVQAEIRTKQSEESQINRQLGGLESAHKSQNVRLNQVQTVLEDVDFSAVGSLLDDIEKDLLDNFGQGITLDNSVQAERQLQSLYNKQRDGQETRLRQMAREAVTTMTDFKNTYPVETQDVDASLEASAILWYEEKHSQIHHHDLPKYKSEFEELVRLKITDSITSFRSSMFEQLNDYQKRIDQLNESLREIAYTTETYIQLIYERTADQQIRAFESDLNNCFPNVDRDGDQANKQAYLHVRDLIDRLDNESYWARKVTDVRNWLDFAADEKKQSDDSQHERYDGASGKSGGQKAKLAYTIMASAIAYQYGIFATRRDPGKTFRFVVVDEVFSKSDESNSRFAMDLFRQLGLQVLVVTPSDKIHIVEPYIGICHWVKNTDEGNDSRVADITIQQLRTMREELGAAD